MKTSNTKKIIYTTSICTLLIATVCLLPLPIHRKLTLQGTQVTREEILAEDVNISIDVWQLRYLFKSTELKGNVEIALNDRTLNLELLGPIYQIGEKNVFWVSAPYYNATDNSYCSGAIWFDQEIKNFVFVISDYDGNPSCYTASVDKSTTPEKIMQPFKQYITNLQ